MEERGRSLARSGWTGNSVWFVPSLSGWRNAAGEGPPALRGNLRETQRCWEIPLQGATTQGKRTSGREVVRHYLVWGRCI